MYAISENPFIVHIGKSIEGNAEWWALYGLTMLAWNKRKVFIKKNLRVAGDFSFGPLKKIPKDVDSSFQKTPAIDDTVNRNRFLFEEKFDLTTCRRI